MLCRHYYLTTWHDFLKSRHNVFTRQHKMKLDIEKFNRMLYIYSCFATKLFIMCRDFCYELWLEFNIYRNV